MGARTTATLARLLAIDCAAAQAVGALEAAGIEAVLVKGASVAGWLYPDNGDLRNYIDADIVADPTRHSEAESVLSRLGFTPAYEDEWAGSDLQPHARPWFRESDGMAIDLHRTLPGLRTIAPAEAWAILRKHRARGRIGGGDVAILDEPARLLLVALHAEHHGLGVGGAPQEDLRRSIELVAEPMWTRAAALARRLDASAQMAIALRFRDDGAALADRLGLPGPEQLAALGPGSEVSIQLGLERLAATPGVRGKLAIIRSELLPSPSALRYTSALARRGRLGLTAAYVRHPVVFVRRLPSAVRAARRMRQRASPDR